MKIYSWPMKCIIHACKLFGNQLLTEEEYREHLLSTEQSGMSWAGHLFRALNHGHYRRCAVVIFQWTCSWAFLWNRSNAVEVFHWSFNVCSFWWHEVKDLSPDFSDGFWSLFDRNYWRDCQNHLKTEENTGCPKKMYSLNRIIGNNQNWVLWG